MKIHSVLFKLRSQHSTVVQCWPGTVGVPSSNLGIKWFYAPTPTIQDEYPLSSIQNKQASIAQWFSACLVISGSRVWIWLLIFDLRQHSEHLSKSLLSPGIKPGTHRVQDRFHGPPHSRPQCGKTNLLPRAVNLKSELIRNQRESVKYIKERPGT